MGQSIPALRPAFPHFVNFAMVVSVSRQKRSSLEDCHDLLQPSGKRQSLATEEPFDPAATIIVRPPYAPDTFADLGKRLREGHLVSFPTETVYGLGANGLDAKAVLKIFEAKGRPLSDPCILHVSKAEEAAELFDLNDDEQEVLSVFTASCWPGPLSIVGRAKACVPAEVTASTGFVAVRCPDHEVARALISAAGRPLAAPSANRFGHISPTLPEHVVEDLGHADGLRVIDGGPCSVGIESTVLRLDLASRRVIILRKGGVTKERLEAIVTDGLVRGTLSQRIAVQYSERLAASAQALRESEEAMPEQAQESPGLLLRHYSPSVPSALLLADEMLPATEVISGGRKLPYATQQSILIDFGQRLQSLHDQFLGTFDLCDGTSETLDPVENACTRVFAVLRAAEAFAIAKGASFICIADFNAATLGSRAEALHDRMFRAASGCRVAICPQGGSRFVQLSG